MTIYIELTEQFNAGRLRAIIASGQAVVLHRLAIASKDGDWILREDSEATVRVLTVIASRGGHYRFGAPLDARWLSGGWSSHFEFRHGILRVRTDFVTRPPRISAARLQEIWNEQEQRSLPFLDAPDLAALKKTNREKDYAVIGELARIMANPEEQLRHSRSARDLLRLATEHPALVARLLAARPALAAIAEGRERLEVALDAERRSLMRANEERLAMYRAAAAAWETEWRAFEPDLRRLPLLEAHARLTVRAERTLPFRAEAPPHE